MIESTIKTNLLNQEMDLANRIKMRKMKSDPSQTDTSEVRDRFVEDLNMKEPGMNDPEKNLVRVRKRG